MVHLHFFVKLDEWFTHDDSLQARDAISRAIAGLMEIGARNLYEEVNALLLDFAGVSIAQNEFDTRTTKRRYRSLRDVSIYTMCFMFKESMVFLDIEPFSPRSTREFQLEFDCFAPASNGAKDAMNAITEQMRKSFGLTASLHELVILGYNRSLTERRVRDLLIPSEPIDENLLRRVRNDDERLVLRELKRRGAILERDIAELAPLGMPADRIKSLLDYLSGTEFGLVDRKFALVCRDTEEIIFLLKARDDLSPSSSLECPKCSRKLGDEEVMAYYGVTDKLRELLDGSRWMPLQVRDEFVAAGVPGGNVLTEVKHGEDEIDVVVMYHGKIFIIEVKNRPVNLNDAYKLSAKGSRLMSMASKPKEAIETDFVFDSPEDFFVTIDGSELLGAGSVGRSRPVETFIPMIISTHDIAKDAQQLLRDTLSSTECLEHCDESLASFIKGVVSRVDNDSAKRAFHRVTSEDVPDSVANLAAEQMASALRKWFKSPEVV